jgi:type IV pilus assembly protein PilM
MTRLPSIARRHLGFFGAARFIRRQVVAIDFDGRHLRIALARVSRERSRLLRVISERLPTDTSELDVTDPQSAGAWVAKELSRLGVSATHAIMAVPRAKVILKPVRLPAVDDVHELAAMVGFQVSKDLPFSAEDAVIDFTVQRHFGHDEEAESGPSDAVSGERVEVLAAAVEKSVVEYYRDLAAAAGLKLDALGLRSYAYQHCLELCGLNLTADGLALVSIRPDEITISVLADNYLTFSRTASVHVPTESEGAGENGNGVPSSSPSEKSSELVSALAMEVRRSLRSYEGMERHESVGHVLIAGDTGLEEHVIAELNQHLGVSCELFDPGSSLRLPADSLEHVRGAVSVIGLASRAGSREGLPFNFLSPKRDQRPRDPGKRRNWLAIAAVAAVLIACVTFYQIVANGKRDELASVLFESQMREQATVGHKLTIRAAHEINKWLNQDRAWLDHWTYLSSVLPPCTEMYVGSFVSTGGGGITLSVHARTDEILAKLDATLRAAGYQVSPISVAPTKDRHGYGFRGTVELRIPTDMKLNLDKYKPVPRPRDDVLRSASAESVEGRTRERA